MLNTNAPCAEAMVEEASLVGTTGTAFEKTQDLKVMTYEKAMADPRRAAVEGGLKVEHDKMMKARVWDEISKDDLLPTDKVLDTTCAIKPKPNGTMRSRVVVRGFQQKEGLQYDKSDVSAPVLNLIAIKIVLVLAVMANWYAYILDVKGAFLNGRFDNGERIIVRVQKAFEKWHPPHVLLLLYRTWYGTIQAAMQFWKQACLAMYHMKMIRSKVNPCLFYQWIDGSLVLILVWVDDFLFVGPRKHVEKLKDKMMQLFDCDDVGELKEYVGCIIERKPGFMRLTQPLQLRKFQDEFDLETHRGNPQTPAEPHSVLNEGDQGLPLTAVQQTDYRKGVGILLHMMRWSRPEILNAVRELSRHMKEACTKHEKQLIRVMKYCVGTPMRGLTLVPNRTWNGKAGMKLRINGMSDSEYMKDPSRHSVNGWSVFLEGCCVNAASKMMPVIALSVTEAELYAAIMCVQDMLYAMRILNSMGLEVELPMILEVDNKGAVDICNSWTVGGRTRHVEVKMYFLRELKEQGLVKVVWKAGTEMTADIYTKNLPGPLFEKHGSTFYGKDEYFVKSEAARASRGKTKPETNFSSFP